MLIFENKQLLIEHLELISNDDSTIGFVPTMGALHNGHLSLIKKSLFNNDISVISIFVNPTQFNNPDDLLKYPRTLENDIKKIKTVSESVIVYAPTVNDIYDGVPKTEHFDFDGLEFQMEGQFRPGHFDGVGTVVKLLFEIVKPTNAYFGEKDFQQLQIIRKLVEKNNLKVNIIGCEIFREPNGLAMSSRNERLSNTEKNQAELIINTLLQVKVMFSTKAIPISKINSWVNKTFKKNPDFKLEYFEIANENNLTKCTRKNQNINFRAFIAVYLNNVRLIDTISLK
jgi:pantoate--beta-alanine ligase